MLKFDVGLLKNVTMLVPTRNRHGYLRHILRAYQGTGLNLIVADTSPAPLDEAAAYPNVRYHHARECRFIDKLRFLAEESPTEAIVLRAENRHITVPGIARCLRRLLSDESLALVHGAHVWVRQKRGRIEAWPCYNADNLAGLMQPTPQERLLACFDPMVSLYYAVERRQNLLDVANLAEGIENLNALEVLLTAVKAVNGKCARERVLFCAIQERPSALKGARHLYDGFDTVARDPRYAAQHAAVELGIATHLAAHTDLGMDEALALTRESLARFLRRLEDRPRETGLERLGRKARRLASSALRLAGVPDLAARRELNAYLDSLDCADPGGARAQFDGLLATIRQGYAEGW